MTKLPRLWDEKITTGKGRKVRRYFVQRRSRYSMRLTVWDRLKRRVLLNPDPMRISKGPMSRVFNLPLGTILKGEYYPRTFRTSKAAENWLKKTTVRSYQLQEVERKLDKIA